MSLMVTPLDVPVFEVAALRGQSVAVANGLPASAMPLAPGLWLVPEPVTPIDGAVVIDKSSAFAAFEVEGPAVREALARLCLLDLDARVFALHATASTLMAQVTVIMTRTGEDRFRLLAPATYGQHFREALAHAIERAAHG